MKFLVVLFCRAVPASSHREDVAYWARLFADGARLLASSMRSVLQATGLGGRRLQESIGVADAPPRAACQRRGEPVPIHAASVGVASTTFEGLKELSSLP